MSAVLFQGSQPFRRAARPPGTGMLMSGNLLNGITPGVTNDDAATRPENKSEVSPFADRSMTLSHAHE